MPKKSYYQQAQELGEAERASRLPMFGLGEGSAGGASYPGQPGREQRDIYLQQLMEMKAGQEPTTPDFGGLSPEQAEWEAEVGKAPKAWNPDMIRDMAEETGKFWGGVGRDIRDWWQAGAGPAVLEAADVDIGKVTKPAYEFARGLLLGPGEALAERAQRWKGMSKPPGEMTPEEMSQVRPPSLGGAVGEVAGMATDIASATPIGMEEAAVAKMGGFAAMTMPQVTKRMLEMSREIAQVKGLGTKGRDLIEKQMLELRDYVPKQVWNEMQDLTSMGPEMSENIGGEYLRKSLLNSILTDIGEQVPKTPGMGGLARLNPAGHTPWLSGAHEVGGHATVDVLEKYAQLKGKVNLKNATRNLRNLHKYAYRIRDAGDDILETMAEDMVSGKLRQSQQVKFLREAVNNNKFNAYKTSPEEQISNYMKEAFRQRHTGAGKFKEEFRQGWMNTYTNRENIEKGLDQYMATIKDLEGKIREEYARQGVKYGG